MKWVKASERLPSSLVKLNLKISGVPAWGYFSGNMDGSYFHFEGYNGFGSLYKENWHMIEYLDESTPTPVKWPDEDELIEIVKMVENAKDLNDKYYAKEVAIAAVAWLKEFNSQP